VRHVGDDVLLRDARRFDSSRPTELTFPSAVCAVPLSDYRTEVVRFAVAVRDAYVADGDKIIDDPEERRLFDAFWSEYHALLGSHGAPRL
jgi:hypothetical protein